MIAAGEDGHARRAGAAAAAPGGGDRADQRVAPLLIAWAVVLLPAAWGVAQTIAKASALFR
jgi:hypothetical protein